MDEGENSVRKAPITFLTISVFSVLICAYLTRPVFAGYPMVNDVVVFEDAGNTMLNVTVFHSPQNPAHYLDFVEVDLNGTILTFPVDYRPENTFTVTCDLGPIIGDPTATVRAHCNIDGYSQSSFGPIVVPEFLNSSLLLMFLLAISIIAILHASRSNISILYSKKGRNHF